MKDFDDKNRFVFGQHEKTCLTNQKLRMQVLWDEGTTIVPLKFIKY